jgi:nucleoid-associated protein YgaU
MAWGRRVTIAVAVFAVGGIAALPFYRAPLPSESSPHKASPAATPNPPTSVALQIPASDLDTTATVPTATIDTHQLPSGSQQQKSQQQTSKPLEVARDVAPPIISNEFPSTTQQVPQVANPIKNGSKSNSRSSLDNEKHGDGPKVHRIRDGDTLRKIAEKYFKNGDRWIEILDANRSILRDPEVLPVGKEIKIPESKNHALEGSNAVMPSIQPTVPQDEPLTRLVPIR